MSPEEERALGGVVARARAEWPALPVTDAELAAHIAARAGPIDGSTRGGELLLAYACAKGHDAALRAFEANHFRVIDVAVARIRPSCGKDEARQIMREKLFVGDPPRILGYAGKGALGSWLRVAVTRALLDLATRAPAEQSLEDSFAASVDADGSPEVALLRKRSEASLRAAFHEAVTALDPRERALLKYTISDGLTVDELGALYDVHRATAARWVAAARERLEAKLRQELRARLGVGDAEAESVVRAVQGGIDLSLSRELGA